MKRRHDESDEALTAGAKSRRPSWRYRAPGCVFGVSDTWQLVINTVTTLADIGTPEARRVGSAPKARVRG